MPSRTISDRSSWIPVEGTEIHRAIQDEVSRIGIWNGGWNRRGLAKGRGRGRSRRRVERQRAGEGTVRPDTACVALLVGRRMRREGRRRETGRSWRTREGGGHETVDESRVIGSGTGGLNPCHWADNGKHTWIGKWGGQTGLPEDASKTLCRSEDVGWGGRASVGCRAYSVCRTWACPQDRRRCQREAAW